MTVKWNNACILFPRNLGSNLNNLYMISKSVRNEVVHEI